MSQPSPPPYAWPTMPPRISAKTHWSFGTGIAGLAAGFACGVPLLLGPVALVLGLVAEHEIRHSQGRLGGRGMAITGIVTGAASTLLLVLGILILVYVLLHMPPSIGRSGGINA